MANLKFENSLFAFPTFRLKRIVTGEETRRQDEAR
jgi:hypothetical protein